MKRNLVDDLASGMHKELIKQGSETQPSLVKAAECLHAALEILEEQGLQARADQILQLLQKIAQSAQPRNVEELPTINKLMEAGLTQRDMLEFSKGSPVAKAKFNLVFRSLGYSDHQIGRLLGPTNVMSEDDARQLVDPNRNFGKMWDWMNDPAKPVDSKNPQPGERIEFNSIAAPKGKTDRHTRNLTTAKMVKNLEDHGHPMNLADDAEFSPPLDMANLKESDFDPEYIDLLHTDIFDVDASDDELFNMDIKDDSLEVSERDFPMEDFEEERD